MLYIKMNHKTVRKLKVRFVETIYHFLGVYLQNDGNDERNSFAISLHAGWTLDGL